MGKKIIVSFAQALHNIRSHFFHTILSVLGIVIGVAALVSILSLIDGMEKYARNQITSTTSLTAVQITTEQHRVVNGVRLKKDDYAYLDYLQFVKLKSVLPLATNSYLTAEYPQEVTVREMNQSVGAVVTGVVEPDSSTRMMHGRYFTEREIAAKKPVAFVNPSFAKLVMGSDSVNGLIGKRVLLRDTELTITGILDGDGSAPAKVFVPITLFSPDELKAAPPRCVVETDIVENVPVLKARIERWLQTHFPKNSTDFSVVTNDFRLEQALKGFLLFRVVMGLIVGISVVVGGIGVMNVLLISVTERTVEIGVRKAVGAKKRDILVQFLSESITVSVFGSLLGLLLGVVGTMVAIPIINALTDIPFQAAYTWNTFLVITAVAVMVGIVFGTYPAMRAARLDPVEAIRRE